MVPRIFLVRKRSCQKTTMRGKQYTNFGDKTAFYVVKVKVNASDSSFVATVEYGKRDRWADR